MALLPLQATFEGDILVILVPVDDQDTMEIVAQKIANHIIGRRLPAKNAPMAVRYQGEILPQTQTVAEAQMAPMAFVEAFYHE